MNPIKKAHLKGMEKAEMFIGNNSALRGDYSGDELKSFLTTHTENILNAVKEAGDIGEMDEEDIYDQWAKGHNSCLSSFHSAINEGIKLIKKGGLCK